MWTKSSGPVLALPPPGLALTAGRDPFIAATPTTSPDGRLVKWSLRAQIAQLLSLLLQCFSSI